MTSGGGLRGIEENKTIVRRAVDVFNHGDWSAIAEIFTTDYVDHDPSRGDLPPGPAGVTQAWRMLRSTFPDLEAEIDDLVADGKKGAVRGYIQGTHKGKLMGIPPTSTTIPRFPMWSAPRRWPSTKRG